MAAGLQGFGSELVEVGLIAGVLGKPMRPLAELGGTNGIHAIADRDNRVQVVVLDLPHDLARAFLANYPKISDSPPALVALAVALPAVAPRPGLPAREAVRHHASDNSYRQQCAHRR